MRILIAGMILAIAVPAGYAKGNKGQCKTQCNSMYHFCMGRSLTKQARKACKAQHKMCRSHCK